VNRRYDRNLFYFDGSVEEGAVLGARLLAIMIAARITQNRKIFSMAAASGSFSTAHRVIVTR
jgi:hypothetical protein